MNGYDESKPHKEGYYPDSKRESDVVLRKMKNPDMEYFLLTDESPREGFVEYMDRKGLSYDANELERIIKESYDVIMAHKRYYNRPRPAQVNSEIKPAESVSASTPSYPSGHAYQAYLIAQHLSKQYPLHYFAFYRIANRTAKARVSVGLHYPSDNKKAFELAHSM